MSPLLKKPHKWIAAKIQSLDPEVDYVEMYRLMNTYQSSDVMIDLMYSYSFPHFMVPFHGAV